MWDARLLTPTPSSHAARRDCDLTLEANHHRIKKHVQNLPGHRRAVRRWNIPIACSHAHTLRGEEEEAAVPIRAHAIRRGEEEATMPPRQKAAPRRLRFCLLAFSSSLPALRQMQLTALPAAARVASILSCLCPRWSAVAVGTTSSSCSSYIWTWELPLVDLRKGHRSGLGCGQRWTGGADVLGAVAVSCSASLPKLRHSELELRIDGPGQPPLSPR